MGGARIRAVPAGTFRYSLPVGRREGLGPSGTIRWMKLSRRGGSIPGSVTLAINARAKELAAEGHRVIRFGVGEPDFDTPEHIK